MRRRRHVVRIERRHLGRVAEDRAQLFGERNDLLLAQREAGELRDVFDIGARDAFGHRREATCTGRGG
jgi:hypothetical protein